MYFDYIKIPADEAYTLRKCFIDNFVDTSHKLFVSCIRDLKATDTVKAEDYRVSFLWSCLKKNNNYMVDFYDAMRYLYRRYNDRVFVMWDIRAGNVIYPEEWKSYKSYVPECEILMKSDEVIAVEPKELCDVLLHDHHIEAHKIGDISRYFLREDVYVFDNTFTWYIALTHEECTADNKKRLCFSNVIDIVQKQGE